MSDDSVHLCPECNTQMEKQISRGAYIIASGISGTIADHKQKEHTKKVKDPERAVKMRKKVFGSDAVGDPKDQPDPKHIIKGRTLGGQQKEVDKQEFIKAAAKDPYTVKKAQEAIKKSKS